MKKSFYSKDIKYMLIQQKPKKKTEKKFKNLKIKKSI